MVHRSGSLDLEVEDVEAARDSVAALAAELGGRVETLTAYAVAIRVPVERFDEAIDRLSELGRVLARSLRAEDVTEVFQATDLRLRTARATLERLQELLAEDRDAETRLELLREIRRLSKEIAALEARARTLRELARLSRIAVTLHARRPEVVLAAAHAVRELAWIDQLSPLETWIAAESRPLRLPVPEGMVALSPRGPLHAESAGGSRFWTHRLERVPRGDADWWVAALRERLAPGHAEAVVEAIG
ncbi:MAG: DUF4349 domain-containing protein, partial [Nitrospirae bacterium]